MHTTEIREIARGLFKGFCSCGWTTITCPTKNPVDRECWAHKANPPA